MGFDFPSMFPTSSLDSIRIGHDDSNGEQADSPLATRRKPLTGPRVLRSSGLMAGDTVTGQCPVGLSVR